MIGAAWRGIKLDLPSREPLCNEDAGVATCCPPGRAVALIRPHEIGLVSGSGPARCESQEALGPLRRTRIGVFDQTFDVLTPDGMWTPAIGQTCSLDLTRARIYPAADERPG